MIHFQKYNSIESITTSDFLDRLHAELPDTLEWVVQEKVHGANCSFICDGTQVAMAKRTSLLTADDAFYDYQSLLSQYHSRVLELFGRVRATYPSTLSVSIFGEIFGGRYPHPACPNDRATTLIQKGVYYTPDHQFYAFDIYVFDGAAGSYLTVDEADQLFTDSEFFYAQTLMRGTLTQCLAHPCAFQTMIPQWLGLPEIDDNLCEGIVIRPVVPTFLPNGARVILKHKNERFSEKSKVPKRHSELLTPFAHSEELTTLLQELEAYATLNRLHNVISHIGEVTFPADFGRVISLLAADITQDFMKEHADAFNALIKVDQKSFRKELNRLATDLIKSYIADSR